MPSHPPAFGQPPLSPASPAHVCPSPSRCSAPSSGPAGLSWARHPIGTVLVARRDCVQGKGSQRCARRRRTNDRRTHRSASLCTLSRARCDFGTAVARPRLVTVGSGEDGGVALVDAGVNVDVGAGRLRCWRRDAFVGRSTDQTGSRSNESQEERTVLTPLEGALSSDRLRLVAESEVDSLSRGMLLNNRRAK